MDQCIKCGGSRESIDRLTRENADLRVRLEDAEKARDEQAAAVATFARRAARIVELCNRITPANAVHHTRNISTIAGSIAAAAVKEASGG